MLDDKADVLPKQLKMLFTSFSTAQHSWGNQVAVWNLTDPWATFKPTSHHQTQEQRQMRATTERWGTKLTQKDACRARPTQNSAPAHRHYDDNLPFFSQAGSLSSSRFANTGTLILTTSLWARQVVWIRILHIKDGKVIKIKAQQTVSALSHQKTHRFLREKERKKQRTRGRKKHK